MKIFKTFSSLVLVSLLMSGCAFHALQPGMSREEVIAYRGKPTGVVPLSTGTRLQYSGQPAGQWAVMVDLDAADRVVAVRQVLTLQEFSKIGIGSWTQGDVTREFGPPATVDRVASWSGDIMTYRWQDTGQDKYFWVYLDDHKVVQRTGQGMEIPVRPHDND